jgi:hypothetical protein
VTGRPTALDRGEHGTHTCYTLGCRCPRCTTAQSSYARRRWAAAQLARTGSARWKVNARPLVEHLDALMADGWMLREIAAAADVPRPTLVAIRQRARRRRHVWCWSTVRDAVLGVELDPP